MTGKVVEIFKSIQGEGIYQGLEQVFIRFFQCNLRCDFCDTKIDKYTDKSVSDIIREIESFSDYHSISLTGGEPLLEVELLKVLAPELKARGKIIYLETNGTLYENLNEIIKFIDIIAMDFKFASSTGLRDYWFSHREFLRIAQKEKKEVFIKAVIGRKTSISDLRIGLSIVREVDRDIPFILQPENPYEAELTDKLSFFEKASKELVNDVRIIPQRHKELGVK